jgi:plastocyanin
VAPWLLPLLLLSACGDSDADRRDMRVEEGAAMDTTPAGTPAPPSTPAIASDLDRQTAVTLTEWNVTLNADALPAGEVTFQAANTGVEVHSLAIEGSGVSERTEPIAPGGASSLTVHLEPGTYRLYCPDGSGDSAHAARGMSAGLVVR